MKIFHDMTDNGNVYTAVKLGEIMKKTILNTIYLSLISSAVLASTYDVHCLNEKGKFTDCKVMIGNGSVDLQYKRREEALNVTIPGNKITALSAGEYSRRRVAEAILLTPWLLFSKKKRDQIGIEYVDSEGHPKATLIQMKKKYGMAFKTELKAISGKPIQEEVDEKGKK